MRWWQELVYLGEEYGEIAILRQPPIGLRVLASGRPDGWRVEIRICDR
jgi:hypothetical protein